MSFERDTSFGREANQPDYPVEEDLGAYATESLDPVGTPVVPAGGAVPPPPSAPPSASPTGGGQSTVDSVKDTVKDQGGQVAQGAKESTQHVAGVAADQAKTVASEAKSQAAGLLDEARGQLGSQASTQQQNLASWVRSIAAELSTMVDRSQSGSGDEPGRQGSATTLVRQVSERAHSVAGWLEQHEPSEVLDEVSRFARRRPGAFLALAAVGGILVGRLTRGLTSDGSSSSSGAGSSSTLGTSMSAPSPVVTTTTSYAAPPASTEWPEPAAAGAGTVGLDEGELWPLDTESAVEPGYLDEPGSTARRDVR